MLDSWRGSGNMIDMPLTTYNVLFLCTGNSARSILAEAILERLGGGRFNAYSAGSFPRGEIHPVAIDLLKKLDHPTKHLRSKSWDEFTGPTSPSIDFIFTVCDNAAADTCPIWPGHPMTAHWGLPDPAAVEGSDDDILEAFTSTYHQLRRRIVAFTQLVDNSFGYAELQSKLMDIGSGISPST